MCVLIYTDVKIEELLMRHLSKPLVPLEPREVRLLGEHLEVLPDLAPVHAVQGPAVVGAGGSHGHRGRGRHAEAGRRQGPGERHRELAVFLADVA